LTGVPPKDFFNLDAAEAERFFADFVARAGPRLEEFRREVATRGGPGASALDESPESLVAVWRWFVEHAGDGGGDLPPWYDPDPPERAAERLPAEVLHDADGLALYLARVFQQVLPELEWGLGREPKRMLYEAQNRPVLKGDGYDVDVLTVAYVKALKLRDGNDRDEQSLLRTFRAWVDPIKAAT
jgi:hypothetical protein